MRELTRRWDEHWAKRNRAPPTEQELEDMDPNEVQGLDNEYAKIQQAEVEEARHAAEEGTDQQ
jgi:hypothetical protein